jgi:hypothetical protein
MANCNTKNNDKQNSLAEYFDSKTANGFLFAVGGGIICLIILFVIIAGMSSSS